MDFEKIRQRLEKRYYQRQEKLENRRQAFLSALSNNLPDFVEKFPSVSKVVIFGSLLRSGFFTELSDVDIAVKDLPNVEYWNAFSWFERCLQFEKIDLVRIEEAKPQIGKYIEKGKVIYEKRIRESETS